MRSDKDKVESGTRNKARMDRNVRGHHIRTHTTNMGHSVTRGKEIALNNPSTRRLHSMWRNLPIHETAIYNYNIKRMQFQRTRAAKQAQRTWTNGVIHVSGCLALPSVQDDNKRPRCMNVTIIFVQSFLRPSFETFRLIANANLIFPQSKMAVSSKGVLLTICLQKYNFFLELIG